VASGLRGRAVSNRAAARLSREHGPTRAVLAARVCVRALGLTAAVRARPTGWRPGRDAAAPCAGRRGGVAAELPAAGQRRGGAWRHSGARWRRAGRVLIAAAPAGQRRRKREHGRLGEGTYRYRSRSRYRSIHLGRRPIYMGRRVDWRHASPRDGPARQRGVAQQTQHRGAGDAPMRWGGGTPRPLRKSGDARLRSRGDQGVNVTRKSRTLRPPGWLGWVGWVGRGRQSMSEPGVEGRLKLWSARFEVASRPSRSRPRGSRADTTPLASKKAPECLGRVSGPIGEGRQGRPRAAARRPHGFPRLSHVMGQPPQATPQQRGCDALRTDCSCSPPSCPQAPLSPGARVVDQPPRRRRASAGIAAGGGNGDGGSTPKSPYDDALAALHEAATSPTPFDSHAARVQRDRAEGAEAGRSGRARPQLQVRREV
jgi:hypothetical protein